jgi:hypothetical protein
MTLFFLSVVASVMGAFLYALILSKKEEQLRHWLGNLRSGWLRRRYVRAFIGAVRGRARETETAAVNYLLLIFPLMVFLVFGELADRADMAVFRGKLSIEGVIGTEAEVRAKLEKSTHKLEAVILPTRIMQFASLAWVFVILVGFIPFRVFQSRFSYELDRLLDYLRTIASRDEIIAIMLKEQKVRDEETLKTFTASILSLAHQYGCEDYARPLWIWDTSEGRN